MSLFFAMADSCRDCLESEDAQDKASHKNNLYMQSSDVLREAENSYYLELITFDDYKDVWHNVIRLRLMCIQCDKNEARVFNFVEKEISIPLDMGLIQREKEEGEIRRDALRRRGIKEEGNLLIVDFRKRRVEK